jgi:hypothetical protein
MTAGNTATQEGAWIRRREKNRRVYHTRPSSMSVYITGDSNPMVKVKASWQRQRLAKVGTQLKPFMRRDEL